MSVPILLVSLFLHFFQMFTVVGTVRDVSGRSVPGVRLEVFDENFQPIRTIFVDSSGQFTVRRLSPGRYQFKVEPTGTPYQEQSTGWIELQSLRVRGGGSETYPLDFVLKFKPNNTPIRGRSVFAQETPGAARAEYERGLKGLNDNNPEIAIASLKKALEIFPDYFDALELLGTEYVKAGQFESAIPLLMHAVKVNSRAPRSFYSLGVAHLKLNQPKESIEYLTKAASLDSANANTPMMLGIAYGDNQQLTEAEASYKRALQLGGPALAKAHFYLAGIYEKQKKHAAAARELELYLKESKEVKDPDNIREMIRKLRGKAATS